MVLRMPHPVSEVRLGLRVAARVSLAGRRLDNRVLFATDAVDATGFGEVIFGDRVVFFEFDGQARIAFFEVGFDGGIVGAAVFDLGDDRFDHVAVLLGRARLAGRGEIPADFVKRLLEERLKDLFCHRRIIGHLAGEDVLDVDGVLFVDVGRFAAFFGVRAGGDHAGFDARFGFDSVEILRPDLRRDAAIVGFVACVGENAFTRGAIRIKFFDS